MPFKKKNAMRWIGLYRGLLLTVLPAFGQQSSFDFYEGAMVPLGVGLGRIESAGSPFLLLGCLMREDRFTAILCKGGAFCAPPEGIVWKEDPEARIGAPCHCLWSKGGYFLGVGEG